MLSETLEVLLGAAICTVSVSGVSLLSLATTFTTLSSSPRTNYLELMEVVLRSKMLLAFEVVYEVVLSCSAELCAYLHRREEQSWGKAFWSLAPNEGKIKQAAKCAACVASALLWCMQLSAVFASLFHLAPHYLLTATSSLLLLAGQSTSC